ncbi:MAG: AAA family ATPase [Candidatus Dadabacteria bacterium]|nr:MAG: AAA family ATPase [Candidatus Dadabacteria bacterium]
MAEKDGTELKQMVKDFNTIFRQIEKEISSIIVGNKEIIRLCLTAIFSGGHVLLEGAPGLGKTRLVRAISETLGLSFKRIQFTPDLMPTDITGTQVLTEDESGKREFVFKQGPIFANIILADEINRATPKTQSALLEAMEEKQITVLGERHVLEPPFFVLATQNPIELEGTYPLPEAQLDRFLLKILLFHPKSPDLKEILVRTTGSDIPKPHRVIEPDIAAATIENMKKLVRQVVVADPLLEIIVRIISALTPKSEFATEKVNKYVRFGPGPRAAQAIILAAKVYALLDERVNLSFEDIKSVAAHALRHRIVLNFQAEADEVTADTVIQEIITAK